MVRQTTDIDWRIDLKKGLYILRERELMVIYLRFVTGYTLQEIATRFRVTRERIRQMEGVAIRKLWMYMRHELKYKED